MNNNNGTVARSPPALENHTSLKNKSINNLSKGKVMRIMFINNLGGGFADFINIEESTTIEKFFKSKMPHEQAGDYLIRVNRQPASKDYVLEENDRVTITPVKIEGAVS